MMARLLAIALALWAGPALADPVRVRTAEHGEFTRIVVDFRDRPEWTLESGDGTLRLVTERPVPYDLEGVYQRIGDRRVRRIAQADPRTLEIALNCACAPDSFTLPNGGLVIDLAAGPPDPARTLRPVAPLPPRKAEQAAGVLPGVLTRAAAAARNPVPDLRTREVRSAVTQMFREAAASGMIDTRGDPAPVAEDPRPAPAMPALAALPAPGEGYRIDTQAARNARGRPAIPPATACPAYAAETLGSWRHAPHALPADASDAQRLEAEARVLIGRGLGAEAGAMLAAAGAVDPLLVEMAAVLDRPAPGPGLTAAADCGPVPALFALLAKKPRPPARIELLLEALDGIDGALRTQLGRRAVAALVDIGRDEAARILQNRLTLVDAPAASDIAELRLETPDDALPEDALLEIVARRTPEAAEAMRNLIDGMVAQGETVPVAILDHATALSAEVAGKERDWLVRSVIRGLIHTGDLSAADAAIVRLARRDAEMASRLRSELFTALLGQTDDALFLRQALRLADRPPGEAGLRVSLAARLTALHVPSLALRILGEGVGLPSRGERLLRARIALGAEQPDVAESHLAGLEGSDVANIRAEITALRARLAPPPEQPDIAPAPSLQARGSALLAETAALREELRGLLNR